MKQMDRLLSSTAIILYENNILCGICCQWLEPLGWTCECRALTNDLVLAPDDCPSLILIDGGIAFEKRVKFLSSLRAMPGLLAGTPVFLATKEGIAGQNGITGQIKLPLRSEQAAEVVEQWVGALGDHGFRNLSSPHYRLVRLVGRTSADQLLQRFADHIETTLSRIDGNENIQQAAHDIAGLAGTLGFGELSALWSAIDRDEMPDFAATQSATQAVLDDLKRLLPRQ